MLLRTFVIAVLAAAALLAGSDIRASQERVVTGRLTHFTDRVISVNGEDFRPPVGRRLRMFGPVEVGRRVVVRYTVINGGVKCATHVKAVPTPLGPRGLAARGLFSVNVDLDD